MSRRTRPSRDQSTASCSSLVTRRGAMRFMAAGAALAACGASARSAETLAPAGGPLKKRVKGRTIDVHAHPSPRGGGTAAEAAQDTAPVTAEERAAAIRRLTLYKPDQLAWDSPEQQDHYIRKYTLSQRHPRVAANYEENAAIFLAEMDAAGIDTSVILHIDFAAPILTDGPVDPSTERAMAGLAACAEVCQNHPGRFIPFAAIDMRRGPSGVALLERAVKEYGFQGCGEIVTTLWQTKPNDRSRAYPYYEACAALDIPVVIDATMDRGFTQPELYEDVVRDFPKLPVCLGGAGLRVNPVKRAGAAPQAAYDRMLELAQEHENIWLDLDDWQVADQAGMRRFLTYLRRALDGDARRKVMFGSDYPVFAWMFTEGEWVDRVLSNMDGGGVRFSDEELELFFSANASDFLRLNKTSG